MFIVCYMQVNACLFACINVFVTQMIARFAVWIIAHPGLLYSVAILCVSSLFAQINMRCLAGLMTAVTAILPDIVAAASQEPSPEAQAQAGVAACCLCTSHVPCFTLGSAVVLHRHRCMV